MNVNYNEEYQVIVCKDDLETEKAFARYIEDGLRLIRLAAEKDGYQQEIVSMTLMLGYLLSDAQDNLAAALRGERTGPMGPMGRQTA